MKKIVLALTGLLLLTACPPKPDAVVSIRVAPRQVASPAAGEAVPIKVLSTDNWQLTEEEGDNWCRLSETSGVGGPQETELTLTVNPNYYSDARTRQFIFMAKGTSLAFDTLFVSQEGFDPEAPIVDPGDPYDPYNPYRMDSLTVEMPKNVFTADEQIFYVTITANRRWMFIGSTHREWCMAGADSTAGGAGTYSFPIKLLANESDGHRETTLAFRTTNPVEERQATVHLTLSQRTLGIVTVEDLKMFRDSLQTGGKLDDWMGADSTIHLRSNIDMKDAGNWTPIDFPLFYQRFHFEGNNHTISNLQVTALSEETGAAGLFGRVSGATISNLTVTGSVDVTSGTFGSVKVGGICGWLHSGTLSNCHFEGSVSYTGAETGSTVNVGGLVGHAGVWLTTAQRRGQLSNCSFSGTVTSQGRTGGIVGYNDRSQVANCRTLAGSVIEGVSEVGGICGYLYRANTSLGILNCENHSTVKGKETVGGIAGLMQGSQIVECTNYGEVLCLSEPTAGVNPLSCPVGGITGASIGGSLQGCLNQGTVTGLCEAGGISGVFMNDQTMVLKCTNAGLVTGEVSVGGICGHILSSSTKLSDCVNTETAQIQGVMYAGGICGNQASAAASLTACENRGFVISPAFAAGIAARSQSNLQNCTNRGRIVSQPQGISGPTVADSLLTPQDVTSGAAGVVALISGSVNSCHNYGEVQGLNAAGITAWSLESTFATIDYCNNYGAVTGTRFAGGIFGYNVKGIDVTYCNNEGVVKGGYSVGGIVAYQNEGTIADAVNTGSVEGLSTELSEADFYLGGITGANNGGSLRRCENRGNVVRVARTGSHKYVGGISGYNLSRTPTGGQMQQCTQLGDVAGYHDPDTYQFVGGVCGFFFSGGVPEEEVCQGRVTRYYANDSTRTAVTTDSDYSDFIYGGSN